MSLLSGNAQLWIDLVLVVLLMVTIGYCLVLNRRLGALRATRGEMAESARELERSAGHAQASLGELARAGDVLGVELEGRLARGRELVDELRRMIESADSVATRLATVARPEPGAAAARPLSAGVTDEPIARTPSESERELRRALRAVR